MSIRLAFALALWLSGNAAALQPSEPTEPTAASTPAVAPAAELDSDESGDRIIPASELMELLNVTRSAGGEPVPLGPIQFLLGSAELTDRAKKQLDELGEAFLIPEFSLYKLEIIGHTDSLGEASFNENLSDSRANAVRSYLNDQYGADIAERISAKGMGETQPLKDLTPEHPKNRRVEVILR